jgi:hypothetical protein
MRQAYHDLPLRARERFVAAGYRAADFFPHRIRYLPKCGPDGAKLAKRMTGISRPESLWQVVIHATPPATDEFPSEIFFDRELLWHQQHFHEPGQVANVTVAQQGGTMYTMAHQSDLVQRISRRRDLKTRVEKVFRGWHHLLLNAIANFAVQRGCTEIRVPTARRMMQFTDPARTVQPELFERVYDRAVHHHFRATETDGWWSIDVAANRAAIVVPEPATITHAPGRTVCIFHDVERGLGHRDVEPDFARRADAESDAALDAMLEVERSAGVRATYVVVGSLMKEVRQRIETVGGAWRGTPAGGHALGFHSYDHGAGDGQLNACRGVDYRLKGYRPPRSRLTTETTDDSLCWYNFEWLASSASSLGITRPTLANRVVHIPVHLDDFPLHTGRLDCQAWCRQVLDMVTQNEFVALGLHDCYAPHWLPQYADLLRDLQSVASLRTMDEVADEVFLAAGA